MNDLGLLIVIVVVVYGFSGAIMNNQVCREAVNKGYSLNSCWFNQHKE